MQLKSIIYRNEKIENSALKEHADLWFENKKKL